MEYRQLGRAGIRVSELGLGTMTFGRECDEPTSRAIVERYLDAGGNLIDTANGYGEPAGRSEEIIGRILEGRRDEVVLATKARFATGTGPNDRGLSRRHLRMALEASLRRLRTDWVDLYQVHSWDPDTRLEETISTLDDFVGEGKVRYLGVSNFAGWHLAKALGIAALHSWEPFVSVQANYSLVGRDLEREVLPLCQCDGLAVLPYGPLGGGMLTGKYQPGSPPPPNTRAGGDGLSSEGMARRMTKRSFVIAEAVRTAADQLGKAPAQVALNWVMNREGITSPLMGARTVDQLDSNLGALGWRLDAEIDDLLTQTSNITLGYPQDFHTWMARIGM